MRMILGKSSKRRCDSSALFWVIAGFFTLVLSACNPTGQTTIGQNFYPGVSLSYSNSTVTVAKPDVASGNPDFVTVYLKDTNGNAFVSTNPTIVLQASGGTSTGTLSSATNNGDGSYTASFTGGNQGTATTIQAIINGQILTSTLPTITVVSAGAPASISVVPPSNNQSGTVGGSPGAPLQAVVKDSNSNVIVGATVTWAVVSGGGAVLGCTPSVANGVGVASCTPTLGTTAGTNTFTASVAGVAIPATFTVTGMASSTIASIVWGTAPSLSYTASSSAPMTTFTAILKDANGNTIASNGSTTVTLSITSGTGPLSGTTTVTVSNGVATFSAVTDTKASTITIQAKENTSNHTVSEANVVVSPGALASIAWTQGPSNTSADSTQTVAVTEYDANGNVLTGDTGTGVTLAAYSTSNCTGGAVAGALSATAGSTSSGVATFNSFGIYKTSVQSILATIGAQTVCAAGLAISAGAAQSIVATSGGGQSQVDGTTLTNPLVATVKDDHANVVSGVSVAWAVTFGNGTTSGCTTSSNGSGQVQCVFTLGTGQPSASNTITATASGVAIPATFTETGTITTFSANWNFSSPSFYSISSSTIDMNNGYAELTPASQTDNSDVLLGFAGGSATGTAWSTATDGNGGSNYVMLSQSGTPTNNSALDSSWAPAWSSIVALWHLDGTVGAIASGATVPDSSGAGANGTLSAIGASYVAGKMNQGISTTGTQKVLVSAALAPNPCTSMTASLWMNSTTAVAFAGIISKTGDSTASPGYAVQVQGSGNSIYLRVDTSAAANQIVNWNSNDNFFDGNWHHVAFTLNAGNVVLYKDGVQDSTGTYSVGAGFCNPAIGMNATAGSQATSDEIAIWNTALTAAQIQLIYNRQSAAYAGTYQSRVMDGLTNGSSWTSLGWTSTLPFFTDLPDSGSSESSSSYSSETANLMSGNVGLWHLDEAAGTSGAGSVEDRSGNGNNGTPYAGVTFGAPGKLGTSVLFDGSTGYLDVGDPASLDAVTQGSYSVSAWFNILGLPPTTCAVNNQTCEGNVYTRVGGYSAMILFNGGTFGCNLQTSGGTFTTSVTPSLGMWHHVVMVVDSTNSILHCYLDGVDTNLTYTGTLTSSAGASYRIGAQKASGLSFSSHFNGFIDEVAIWSRILSSSEALELYRRGVNRIKYQVRSCPDSACGTNPTWMGPDGTNQTYFSELNNNAVQSAGGDVTGGDSVQAGSPTMMFSNFSGTGLSVSNNRYFQYRAILESDDTGTDCNYGSGATWCSPELQSVTVGPTHYDSSGPSITNNVGVNYVTLVSLVETLGTGGCSGGTVYNLSPNGTAWYYWNGSNWTIAGGTASTASSAATLAANLSTFATQVGAGTIYFKVFLQSSGTSSCVIDNLAIGGTQ